MDWTTTLVVTVVACALCMAVDHWVHVGLSGKHEPPLSKEAARRDRALMRALEPLDRDDDQAPPQAPHRKAA